MKPLIEENVLFPLVTIAIPNYNMGSFIGEALESALSQTYQKIEIIVVDNASTDNSVEVIESYQNKTTMISLYKYSKHVSNISNWNRCLKHSKGEYIVFLHADDRLKNEFAEKCCEVYRKRPDLGYVFCEKEIINEHGEFIAFPKFYKESGIIPGASEARVNLLGWHTAPVQMLIRTDCMRSIGGYEFSDVMLALRLNLGWDVGYISDPYVQYRQHFLGGTSQSSKSKTVIMLIYMTKMMIIDNYHNYLTEKNKHLRELRPQIMERTAYTCLSIYAMDVLGRGEVRLCREYMHLAQGFCIDINESLLYRFLDKACLESGWTPDSLRQAWADSIGITQGSSGGAPYPLPEGSEPL